MPMPASAPNRVVVLLAAVGVALLLLFAGGFVARADDAGSGGEAVAEVPAPAGVEYRVQSGDTLWAIAAAHAEPGDDVRVLVEDIRRASGLESSLIHPGQVLVIPPG